MSNLLTMRGLRIEGQTQNGWQEIVHGIDLDLKPGEVLGLVGESGAGKSTIGLAAMGYARNGCRISGGEILFKDRDLAQASQKELESLRGASIAYVAQSAAASFNPAHRLIDQFSEAPLHHGTSTRADAQSDAQDLYGQMLLPDPDQIGFRYPHQVSGGQLQRAMTAMAMACRPDLIIFDEPTTALDVTTQIEVLSAIRDIVKNHNTAAIYITHDLAVVSQMADRVMVLRHGNVVEVNTTKQMLEAPQQEYTKSLWAVRNLHRDAKPIPSEAPLLSVRNLSAAYGAKTVLNDVSFDIYAGRSLAVVGESGSGKSTTARALTGLLPPVKGEVTWQGTPLPRALKERSREDLRHIQMIYQIPDTALNPRQSVRDIISRPLEFYLGLRGKAKEARLHELMEQIELDPKVYLDRLIPELSGGQKQRIGIARALAAQPQFIICDEVTSALDQLVAEGILKLLMLLQDELGLAYMFFTHDLAMV
jgi:peptide/nickel transport system ATP-binding protein